MQATNELIIPYIIFNNKEREEERVLSQPQGNTV